MNVQEVVNYWIRSAEDDLKTVEALWQSKRYNHCLFFCHLVVEKVLKALVVKHTGEQALPVHNLIRLARDAGLVVPLDKEADLEEINTFNVRARYNDYKLKFYKKATREYTEKWYKRSLGVFQWLKKQI